ncbi:MAG: hypothetical protein QOK05_1591 [Chloroflexota bacterium]|jgi:uncharacterized protein (DUF58 family)|nr:hypothetical protein [Chloroflexota bacterium]
MAHRLGLHVAGDAKSRLRGPGIEYADVREYQASEDARMIDWNLTARSDRPFVREAHPDRGLDVWLLVDASRSLDWGTVRSLKRDSAAELVDLLTLLLARHGSRVGGIVFDTRLRRILALTGGRQGRLQLVSRIAAESAAATHDGRTDLEQILRHAGRVITRPSLVIVISDFLVDAGWQKPLRALSLRHDVVAARISDPTESALPAIGIVTFEDPETGAQVEVDTGNRKIRERYSAAATAQRGRLLKDLRSSRAQLLEISTAEPVVSQLIAYLRVRQATRGALQRAGRA